MMKYKVVQTGAPMNEGHINTLARDGWRLTSILHHEVTGFNYYYYYLEKPIEEPLIKSVVTDTPPAA